MGFFDPDSHFNSPNIRSQLSLRIFYISFLTGVFSKALMTLLYTQSDIAFYS
jgi:hypothetical protein